MLMQGVDWKSSSEFKLIEKQGYSQRIRRFHVQIQVFHFKCIDYAHAANNINPTILYQFFFVIVRSKDLERFWVFRILCLILIGISRLNQG